jgi:hypothetical protein
MLERTVEKKLVDKIKRMGGEAVKFVSPASRGWPDRLVLLPEGRVAFVELKTDKGVLSEIQKHRIATLQKLGHEVHVLYGVGDVESFK